MDYNPEKFEEPKVGNVEDTTIVSVRAGKAADILPAKMRENSQYPIDPEGAVLEVKTANDVVAYFTLPKDNVVKPRANLAMFKKKYGSYPQEGMSVKTQMDANGFESLLY